MRNLDVYVQEQRRHDPQQLHWFGYVQPVRSRCVLTIKSTARFNNEGPAQAGPSCNKSHRKPGAPPGIVGQAHRLPGEDGQSQCVQPKRSTIKRCLVRFGMANRSNVRLARPGRDFPAHRAICRVATHRSAEDDRNSQVENSTMRLVPGASTVSLRLKNSPASRLDLALARRKRACGRASGSPQALSSA